MKFLADRLALLDKIKIENKKCVEIGVFSGDFSEQILSRNPSKLWLIDPWKKQKEELYQNDHSNLSNINFDLIYETVVKKFSQDERVHVVRDFSYFSAEKFESNSLDFVYVDAIHTYESCLCDIFIWSQKIKKNGWICGHDYTGGFIGVSRAVESFCRITGYSIDFVTTEDWGSWAIQKKELPLQLP